MAFTGKSLRTGTYKSKHNCSLVVMDRIQNFRESKQLMRLVRASGHLPSRRGRVMIHRGLRREWNGSGFCHQLRGFNSGEHAKQRMFGVHALLFEGNYE